MNIKAHHAAAISNLFEKRLDERIGGIAHNADAACAWQTLADQLEIFAANSADVADNPVTLPSGLARFVISPVAMGSPADPMTIGMSRVAFFAAITAGACEATMMSTLLRTSSSAMPARRSVRPRASWISNWMVCPSIYPSSRERLAKRSQEFQIAGHEDAKPRNSSLRMRPERQASRRAAEQRDELASLHCVLLEVSASGSAQCVRQKASLGNVPCARRLQLFQLVEIQSRRRLQPRAMGRGYHNSRSDMLPEVDIAPPHSITSSARASNDGGTARPSALAVLRLIASSYLVGACTGRSAGFSPFRIRST